MENFEQQISYLQSQINQIQRDFVKKEELKQISFTGDYNDLNNIPDFKITDNITYISNFKNINDIIYINVEQEPYNIQNFGKINNSFSLSNNMLIKDIYNLLKVKKYAIILRSYYGNWLINSFCISADQSNNISYCVINLISLISNYSSILEDLPEKENLEDDDSYAEKIDKFILENLTIDFNLGILIHDFISDISYFSFKFKQYPTVQQIKNYVKDLK